MARLDGKVALISGAGAGIGRASAIRLAADGAAVVATDLDGERAASTAQAVTDAGGRALALPLDVSDEQQWVDVVARTVEQFGGIDVLFNSAGIYVISALEETSVELWNRMMSINVTGTFLGMKHSVAHLVERGGGSIINMSSAAGLIGLAGHTAYGATKGAVRLMTKDVAAEYAAHNVRVNSVHPTYVKTAMADYGAEVAGASLDDLGNKMIPLGRLAEAEEVANCVAFLASDESSYMTAGEFVLDGGAIGILAL
ncbi:glucose 1-dehydrogenase [Gordonia sp. TBRC 11910]|uniref:Glucose 1-dehydrogenase n=1 Tax=Gordonia asplenii TaxID=2725283 RepID=A0A848L6M7_9ACTN|nr:glucose 1-dehydrogenase [Gordonia asplenii]NMO04343.1 glucose 1-dehydrogenase [Gordonia asplenii]